jgi:hypothetical protein
MPYTQCSQDISLNENMFNNEALRGEQQQFHRLLRLSMTTTIHHHKNTNVMKRHRIPQTTQI